MVSSLQTVEIGVHNRNNRESWVQVRKFSRIFIHESYSASTLFNDISLIRLMVTLKLESNLFKNNIPHYVNEKRLQLFLMTRILFRFVWTKQVHLILTTIYLTLKTNSHGCLDGVRYFERFSKKVTSQFKKKYF